MRHSLVAVPVLVNVAALRHHGLFVQGEGQFQLKQKKKKLCKADKLNNQSCSHTFFYYVGLGYIMLANS